MGFLRKSIIIATGGLAPIKAQSYRERTAKAAERTARAAEAQLRIAPAATPRQAQRTPVGSEVHCPYCNRALPPQPGVFRCTNCNGRMKVVGPNQAVRARR